MIVNLTVHCDLVSRNLSLEDQGHYGQAFLAKVLCRRLENFGVLNQHGCFGFSHDSNIPSNPRFVVKAEYPCLSGDSFLA
jgi:hypothetical protein